jgi:hypothetical protein
MEQNRIELDSHPKSNKLNFYGYHANQLHDNTRDIQDLIERLNYLEDWYERGAVSRQLIALCTVSFWVVMLGFILMVFRDIMGGAVR